MILLYQGYVYPYFLVGNEGQVNGNRSSTLPVAFQKLPEGFGKLFLAIKII